MSSHDHNNSKAVSGNSPARPAIQTIGDLRNYIRSTDLPSARKAQIASALKRADQLIGHGSLDLAADAPRIMAKLSQFSPAMAGMNTGAFANLKSRVRTAFRIANGRLRSAVPKVPRTAEWQSLQGRCHPREWRDVSRLGNFAIGQGWQPSSITDDHIERFTSHLREVALVAGWSEVIRQTIRSWNRVAAKNGDLGLARLTPPAPKRTPYWLDLSQCPEGLRSEIAEFLAEIANPPMFGKEPRKAVAERRGRRRPVRRKLQKGTVEQYRYAIISMASALSTDGCELASITSLRVLTSPENLKRSMTFLHRRSGEVVTSNMLTIAIRARKIAEWCGAPVDELEKLDDLVMAIKSDLPRSRGMTAKNKSLIDRLDDPRFRDHVVLLPRLLLDRARGLTNRLHVARTIRTALAIELLLVCGMRRENLAPLELDKTIRKLGDGKSAFWVLEIAEEDVKNEEPLRFQLPTESAELLELYLEDWRPVLCSTPTPWLFPKGDGDVVDERTLTVSIQRATEKILGVPISTHQFRHIAAELYLRQNPEGLVTVSQHLAHRDTNTTRHYYARPKQREASRIYQERVILDRTEAAARARRRSRR